MSGAIHCRVCGEAIRGEYRADSGLCSQSCWDADHANDDARMGLDGLMAVSVSPAREIGYHAVTWMSLGGIDCVLAFGALRAWRIAQYVAFHSGCEITEYVRTHQGDWLRSKKVA